MVLRPDLNAPMTQDDLHKLLAWMHSQLIVRHLQSVLKRAGLPAQGLKNQLQQRLKQHLEHLVATGNTVEYARVRAVILNPEGVDVNAATPTHRAPSYSAARSTGYSPVAAGRTIGGFVNTTIPGFGSTAGPISHLTFRESPFHSVVAALSEIKRCPVMQNNRFTAEVGVELTENQVQQLKDGSYKAMAFCTLLDSITPAPGKINDIAFPHSSELRVNQQTVERVNLRGLKGKPGTTRPADITRMLTLKPGYKNTVGLMYAMTQKVPPPPQTHDHAFVVNLVKAETVDNLVAKLKSGDVIAKETVIADLIKKNEDPDLIATSTVMSLKCPLSTLRIDTPVRSRHCKHMQCFDAASFLQLQEQAPTWQCPTCNNTVNFRQLVVDKYFDDILMNTPRTVNSITIDPDGKWSIAAQSSNSPMPDDSDDDESPAQPRAAVKAEIVDLDDSPPSRPAATASNPTSFSLAAPKPGATPTPRPPKRPISQVIDLTLSDDDEPPPQRVKTGSGGGPSVKFSLPTPNSLGGYGMGSERSSPSVSGVNGVNGVNGGNGVNGVNSVNGGNGGGAAAGYDSVGTPDGTPGGGFGGIPGFRSTWRGMR